MIKRFYNKVECQPYGDGFLIYLDDKPLSTPAKQILKLPTKMLAEAIADEWEGVTDKIDRHSLPFFKLATTIIDRVPPQRFQLTTDLLSSLSSDVVRYRSEDEILNQHQAENWDPVIGWLKDSFGLEIGTTIGIMPMRDISLNIDPIKVYLNKLTDWQLGCFYCAEGLSESFSLSLYFLCKKIDASRLFALAFLDELYQNEKWGCDELAQKRQDDICAELRDIEDFMAML